MSRFKVAPLGKLIQGSIFDMKKKNFDRILKAYDPYLYSKWNPEKLNGHGCWEIRRKPMTNSVVEVCSFEGNTIVKLAPKESKHIHHVIDTAFLTYEVINKIISMDCWNKDNWINDIDYHEEVSLQKWMSERDAQRAYALRHYKKEVKDIYAHLQSGNNPAQLAALAMGTKKGS